MQKNHEENILISIIIPCRNEEKFIWETISSLLQQECNGFDFEILVVDGMSDDRTRKILSEISSQHDNVRIIDNPLKVTPSAFNLGILNAKGKYISILGAHAEYASDFLLNNLELMELFPDVECTGGPIISRGKSNFAKAVSIAMSSSIGVGNAKHRFPDYEGYAEMACFPTFRREVFEKYGLYDESLIKNQDDEYCFRMRLKGGKIYISPKVKSNYFVRDNVVKLFSQYYQYGKWRIPVLLKHKIPISYRQQIPALFFLTIAFLFIIAFYFNNVFIGLFLPVIYIIILTGFAIYSLKREKFSIIWHLPTVVFILHFSYAVGFISGIIKFSINKIRIIF
jgi:succinoglycan biosynthesis protein ExoA